MGHSTKHGTYPVQRRNTLEQTTSFSLTSIFSPATPLERFLKSSLETEFAELWNEQARVADNRTRALLEKRFANCWAGNQDQFSVWIGEELQSEPGLSRAGAASAFSVTQFCPVQRLLGALGLSRAGAELCSLCHSVLSPPEAPRGSRDPLPARLSAAGSAPACPCHGQQQGPRLIRG